MAKQPIKLFDLWTETMASLQREGLLLSTVGADGRPNIMTIGWMTGGVIWGKPILTVYVRPSRFSYTRLEQVAEFTVNALPASYAEAIQYCGTASGRDGDKLAHAKLKAVAAQRVQAPILEQGLIHYECRVVHRNDIIPSNLTREIMEMAYANGDYHRVYFGEVLAAYAAAGAREALSRKLL